MILYPEEIKKVRIVEVSRIDKKVKIIIEVQKPNDYGFGLTGYRIYLGEHLLREYKQKSDKEEIEILMEEE